MPRNDKLSMYRTTIASKNGNTCITYVNTVIVEFDAECIILRSGGYETVTTKRKMNQTARQFDLPYCVYQRKGLWYVDARNPDYSELTNKPYGPCSNSYWLGLDIPFRDGMVLDRKTGMVKDAPYLPPLKA